MTTLLGKAARVVALIIAAGIASPHVANAAAAGFSSLGGRTTVSIDSKGPMHRPSWMKNGSAFNYGGNSYTVKAYVAVKTAKKQPVAPWSIKGWSNMSKGGQDRARKAHARALSAWSNGSTSTNPGGDGTASGKAGNGEP